MGIRPHDLLRLSSIDAVEAVDPPAWVGAWLGATPWVVVRRAGESGERIAIGVRGTTRAERFAAFVGVGAVAERLSPEQLRDRPPRRAHPAFDAMALMRSNLDAAGLEWGPAGGAGYELATGREVLTADSDLDIVVFAPVRPSEDALVAISRSRAGASLRVDVLMETPAGAIAFDELAGDRSEILLRTSAGPRFVARLDLWAARC